MSESNKISKLSGNLIYLFTGEAISSALAFVITIILARRLSDEGFGILAVMQSIMVYLFMATDMGLGTLGAREIARQPNKVAQFAGSIISLRLILSFIFAVPFSAVVVLLPMSMEMRMLCWSSVLGLFTHAFNPEFAFQGSQRMCGIAAWRSLVHVFYLVLIFVIISGRGQLWVVPLLRFVAEAITLILIGVWLLRRHEQIPAFTWKPHIWYGYLRESLMMAASIVAIKLYYTFDTIMLGIMDQPDAVGWYQAGYKIIILFIGTAGLAQFVFAPVYAQNWLDPKKLDDITYKLGVLLLFIAFIVTSILVLFSQQIINTLFGSAFHMAGASLKLLAWSMYFVFLGTIFIAPLLYINRHREYFFIVACGAAVNIVLNLILIPSFSARGAALATIISNVIIFIFAMGIYRKVVYRSGVMMELCCWALAYLVIIGLIYMILSLDLVSTSIIMMSFILVFAFHYRALFITIIHSLNVGLQFRRMI